MSYNPEKDIPDLSGQVILVTGGTAGLGTQAILLFAAHNPTHVYFTGRSVVKANEVIADVKSKHPSVAVTFIEIDLTSLASVQSGARKFIASNTRLDKLICNAGVMALPPGLTKDGYELQFGTNHVGHALLVKLLLPTLTKTAKLPKADNFAVMGPWQRYGQSKLANILYAAELARRYPDSGVMFLSIHPGIFSTGLVNNLGLGQRIFIKVSTSVQGGLKEEGKGGQGAWNTCWAATAKSSTDGKDIVNGNFYYPVGKTVKMLRDGANAELAGKLFEWTEKELAAWN